ncbi:MAG: flagellar motor switch protein FliM [Ilumatobacter sp.]
MSDPVTPETSPARLFDFRHPSTLSRDDARTLQVLQETMAHGIATMLASAVRASIDVQIKNIEQTPFIEVVRRAPNPSALALMRLDPIGPNALLQIDPELSFSLVELLLGGPGTGPHPNRAHTEVEEALLLGLIDQMRPSIDEAFAPLAPVESSVVAQESDPTFVQIAPATDMVVSFVLDIGVDAVRGYLRLVVPSSALRPLLDELNVSAEESPGHPEERAAIERLVAEEIASVDVDAVARFDPVIATSGDLMGLAVGDVLCLEHSIETPLILEIGGIAVHDISIGQVKRNLAAEVLGPAPAQARRPNRLVRIPAGSSPDTINA